MGYTSTNLDMPWSVVVAGRYAYVASTGNDRLAIFDLDHLEAPTADIGSLRTDQLFVDTNAVIGRDASIQGSLTVGQDAEVNGDMVVQENLVARDVVVQGNLYATTMITTVTGSTTLEANQAGVVLVNNSANATIILPSAASAKGLVFTIKRLSTNAITIDSAAGWIDGAATKQLTTKYDFVTVISDGTDWYIISQ